MGSLANGKNVINLPKLQPTDDNSWFWNAVTATGIEPLTRTGYSVIDHGLMMAFAERWHSETNIFHLPIGEADITLDDVQCLLHLPITRPFLIYLLVDSTRWRCGQMVGYMSFLQVWIL
jgi:hypothetical protein